MSIQDTERVATWTELVAHLGSRWGALSVSADSVRVTVDDHVLEISHVETFGVSWIEIRGRLGVFRFASPRFVLTRNFRAPIGAMGISDGVYILRQMLPLDQVRLADIDVTLTSIASQCRESIRQLASGTEITP